MTAPLITTVTAANFNAEVMESPLPVLIDFYADWCGPCKQMAPTLDTVAREQAGKVKVVKINVDHAPELADLFSIRSIPTLVVMKDGQALAGATGNLPKKSIESLITQALQRAQQTNIQSKPAGRAPRP